MADDKRPRGREKNITGAGKEVYRRGSGLGSGPVGSGNGNRQNTPSGEGDPFQQSVRQTRSTTSSSKKISLPAIIVALVVMLFGGNSLLGGNSSSTTTTPTTTSTVSVSTSSNGTEAAGSTAVKPTSTSSLLNSLFGYSSSGTYSGSGSSVSYGWTGQSNIGKLDTSVSKLARAKYYTPIGKGKDTVTIMLYLCGTDLESKSGMATADLQEMATAGTADNVNLIVFTGGCTRWQLNGISTKSNQIYQLVDNKLKTLEADMGTKSMTDPATLSQFIKYCTKNFPADRNMLILWDHGGGSVSGYGYDQRYSSTSSMTLSGIQQALQSGGTKFDFIGFDACLMATAENALMLESYADYLIASEETEPGIGWYYTGWLDALNANTSISTLELGKKIVDDFVSTCASKCSGQKATLSVIDLAELKALLPDALHTFSVATEELIQQDYEAVSYARSTAREFATSTKIDQIDLISLALKLNTDEGNALADALLSAIKYNRASSNMTDAYGLSIYFPYKKLSYVDTAVATYDAIGMDEAYSRCIQSFATMETAGQTAAGGSSYNPYSSLYSSYGYGSSSSSGYSSSYGSSGYGSSSASSSSGSSGYSSYGSSSSGSYSYSGTDALSQMLGLLLGGSWDSSSVSGLNSGNTNYFGRSLDIPSAAEYLDAHAFDASALVWTKNNAGNPVISLSQEQWSLVHELELSLFLDDGEGYIDLGLDNVFEFTDNGDLLGSYEGTWLAINNQPVAYYHLTTIEDGDSYSITGRVPVLLNGDRADLMLVFDDANPYGYVAGISYDYRNGETDTVAKLQTELQLGDKIDFLCDYYTYDGTFSDSYRLGDQLVYDGTLTVSDVYLTNGTACPMYLFTDLYNQQYWTPVLP